MNPIDSLITTRDECEAFFYKYISANDAGATGSHQAGFYMPGETWPMFLEREGQDDENLEERIKIEWPQRLDLFNQGEITESAFKWYGQKTRSEYRLTSGFNFLSDENVGDLLVFFRLPAKQYRAYLLSSDEDIEEFFSTFGLFPADALSLQTGPQAPPGMFPEKKKSGLEVLFEKWMQGLTAEFPPSVVIATKAREFWQEHQDRRGNVNPDTLLLRWLEAEFELFKFIENDRYKQFISKPFASVDSLIQVANKIINRRKSRAGYSLEHHLAAIFNLEKIEYDDQAVTEGKKKPDFIFPGIQAYRDPAFPPEQLFFLGVKTTCKDRWRQILNEADRIKIKHLFTLQQGISSNQLEEMKSAGVVLVVPDKYKKLYPEKFQAEILSLKEFMDVLKPTPKKD